MRRPIKPFVVEVKRTGRGSGQPTRDMWATAEKFSPAPHQGRKDADRAFAAASRITDAPNPAESNGRLLVANGYRSPLELRLEEDELDRAGRRRTSPTKTLKEKVAPISDHYELAEVPERLSRNGASDEAVEAASTLESRQTANRSKRNASERPRHLRWMKRLRHLQQHGR